MSERDDAWRRFRVLRGPFQEFTGELVGFGPDDETVVVLLNVFGRRTPSFCHERTSARRVAGRQVSANRGIDYRARVRDLRRRNPTCSCRSRREWLR
jgi:hypothetical protein